MKIVFDTNVLISAFITHGLCNEIFDYCLIEHELYTSQWILEEFRKNLLKKFGFSKDEIGQAINLILKNSVIIKPVPLMSRICSDPADDNILAAAITGEVDFIITGDNDLLKLNKIQGIQIIKPSAFWKHEKNQTRS
jgi:putative PIN family toxin of toxin-antitoxin system